MKQHGKDIALALFFVIFIQFFCVFLCGWLIVRVDLPTVNYSVVNPVFVLLFLLLLFIASIVPFYFALKHFARRKRLFSCIAFGFHLPVSFLSAWLLNQLSAFLVVSGWDILIYFLFWVFTVGSAGGTLLLDVIISFVRARATSTQVPAVE